MTIFLLKFALFSKPFQKVLACEKFNHKTDSGQRGFVEMATKHVKITRRAELWPENAQILLLK